ncbi:MAG: peptidyl-prolyl cis-trans isomerase [Treponema sp.]|nr:peptidyl-prolyl cis-trans isomerase [Treponema sp.]
MKRLCIALLCAVVTGLFFPGMVFCGGKSDKNADKNADSKENTASSAPVSAAPAETSLQDTQVVATIQVAPSIARETIFRGQLKSEVDRMEKSARRPLTDAERRQVLDVMINERLAVQAAERDRVVVSENEINQQIQQLRAGMVQSIGRQPTDAEFAQAIKNETGLDLQMFRDQLRRQLIVQKYLQFKKQPLFESIKAPTVQEITNAYNLAKTQFVRPDTVRFSMIQVPYGADAAAKTRAKELADRLFREIGSTASKFDEVAARGQSPNSGYQAGDGGYLPKTPNAQQIVGPDFMDAAFSLRQGEVSKLIEGPRAYQIIKITETFQMKNLELGDIYQLGTRMTVRDFISGSMLQQRQQAVLAQASQELVNELRAGNTFQIVESNLSW